MKVTTTKNLVLASVMTLGVAMSASAQEIAIAIHVDPAHAMFKVGERLKQNIEEQTEGEMTVTLLGTEVGGERDHLEGVSYGEYNIALGGSMPMTLYAPKFAAADLPFVYDSSDEARQVYEGETGEAINKQLVANGNMRLVGPVGTQSAQPDLQHAGEVARGYPGRAHARPGDRPLGARSGNRWAPCPAPSPGRRSIPRCRRA